MGRYIGPLTRRHSLGLLAAAAIMSLISPQAIAAGHILATDRLEITGLASAMWDQQH